MQAIVVTFDRLAASALGCYGNEWIETPHFDRLAAQGVVFDQHFSEHVGLVSGMGWGTGRIPLNAVPRPVKLESAWSSLMKFAGIELELFTEFDVRPWSMILAKSIRTLIATPHDPALKPDEIPFAGLVKSVRERLAEPRDAASRIVWLHSGGIPEPWVPPEGFATLYFEDFEERGYPVEPLSRHDWGTHPAVYAGYVSLLDHWLGELVKSVEATVGDEPTLLIVTSARGAQWMKSPDEYEWPQPTNGNNEADTFFNDDARTNNDGASDPGCASETVFEAASRERGNVKAREKKPALPANVFSLADTIVRTPLLIRLFNHGEFAREFGGTRSSRLVQTIDVPATLLDFFKPSAETSTCSDGRSLLRELVDSQSPREMICLTDGEGSRGLRTRDWYGVIDDSVGLEEGLARMKLFAKPEDIHEVNDVSGQHRELTASLCASLNEMLPAAVPSPTSI